MQEEAMCIYCWKIVPQQEKCDCNLVSPALRVELTDKQLDELAEKIANKLT